MICLYFRIPLLILLIKKTIQKHDRFRHHTILTTTAYSDNRKIYAKFKRYRRYLRKITILLFQYFIYKFDRHKKNEFTK